MRDIEARLIEVRKELGLSQEKFGAAVGMSRSEIKNLEYDKTTLKDIAIPLFCRAYNIDETWLRTGVGEMFAHSDREEEIAAYMGQVLQGTRSEFEKAILSVMAQTTPAEWDSIARKMVQITERMKKEKPDH